MFVVSGLVGPAEPGGLCGAVCSSDLNAHSFSSVLARLDHSAERLNQQDQVISDNNVRIQSFVSSFDQF